MPWATPPWTWPSTISGLMTRPAIVRDAVSDDLHAAGHDIDLDFGHMGAGAIGGLRRRVIGGVLEARRLAGRQRHARNALRQSRQFAEADGRPVAAAGNGLAVFEIDSAFLDAEGARRERNELGAHRDAGELRRAAGIDRLPAGERADALGDRRGIADGHHDVFDAAADLFGDDLRQRGAGALALVGGAGRNRDLAARQHPHGHALERTEAGALDVVGDADADEAALAEAARWRWRNLVAGKRERGLLASRIIAAVVDQRLAVAENQADLVGHLLGLDEIARAHLGAIELELARDAVDQPLHGEHRLRPAGATHRRGRHLVGEHHHGFEPIGRNHVGTRHRRRGDIGHDDAPRHEGAAVVQHAAAHARESSPSASTAMAMSQYWSRSWVAHKKCSRRSSIHFTGRPSFSAAAGIAASSG